MPVKPENFRISVTLTPEQYGILASMASEWGCSASKAAARCIELYPQAVEKHARTLSAARELATDLLTSCHAADQWIAPSARLELGGDAAEIITWALEHRMTRTTRDRLREWQATVERFHATQDAPDAPEGPQDAPAPVYERYELEAFLGEFVDEYDVDAIEHDATAWDGRRTVWAVTDPDELWELAERHALPRE